IKLYFWKNYLFLKDWLSKIPLLFLLALLLGSCSAVKRVEDQQHLLTKNTIYVDGSKINTRKAYNQLSQEPNTTLPLINFPLRLHIYNMAKPNPDSIFYEWLDKKPKRPKRLKALLSKKQVERLGQNYVDWQNFKEEIGEAPAVINKEKTDKSAQQLRGWYWNYGWFNAETSYEVDTLSGKRAEVNYYVTPKEPYKLDSLSIYIESEAADSLYQAHKDKSLLKEGQQFDARRFEWERNRLTTLFR